MARSKASIVLFMLYRVDTENYPLFCLAEIDLLEKVATIIFFRKRVTKKRICDLFPIFFPRVKTS